jgi:hypothetical protein
VQTIASTEIFTAMALSDGTTVLLGTHPSGIVYRSTDSGASFVSQQTLGTGPGQSQIFGFTLITDGTILAFVNSNGNATAAVWASTDKGATWTSISSLDAANHYHEPVMSDASTILAPATRNDLGGAASLQRYRWLSGPLTAVPEDLSIEYDGKTFYTHVYVQGANPAGSGLFSIGTMTNGVVRTATLQAPDCTTRAMAQAMANMYLGRVDGTARGQFTISNVDGWRAGQNVNVTDADFGVSGIVYKIARVTTTILKSDPVTPLRKYLVEFGGAGVEN